MDQPQADDVLARQVALLHDNAFVIPVNMVNAAVTAAVLWHSFPSGWLIGWLAAMAAVVTARLQLRRQYRRAAAAGDPAPARWACLFTAGAAATGLVWGALCAGLAVYGTTLDFFFLALMCAGMTAGGLTSLSPFLPAFIGYVVPFATPIAAASLLREEPAFMAIGGLTVLYTVMIALVARSMSRTIARTFRLEVENRLLNRSFQSALARLEAARTDKWTMLAHLSHELRTPLNAILGFSEAMRGELFGPLGSSRYRDYAGHLQNSGRHLLNLANEILDLSQSESGNVMLAETEIALPELVGGCLELVRGAAEAAGVALRDDVPEGLPRLRADDTKVRQILLNLLSNGIKFTPTGGEVSVSASMLPEGGLALAVADTGVGMAPADIPRALTPFVRLANPMTRDSEGTGLGLPLCARLAELHQAELAIESRPGEGTRCTVLFPATRVAGAITG